MNCVIHEIYEIYKLYDIHGLCITLLDT